MTLYFLIQCFTLFVIVFLVYMSIEFQPAGFPVSRHDGAIAWDWVAFLFILFFAFVVVAIVVTLRRYLSSIFEGFRR